MHCNFTIIYEVCNKLWKDCGKQGLRNWAVLVLNSEKLVLVCSKAVISRWLKYQNCISLCILNLYKLCFKAYNIFYYIMYCMWMCKCHIICACGTYVYKPFKTSVKQNLKTMKNEGLLFRFCNIRIMPAKITTYVSMYGHYDKNNPQICVLWNTSNW